MLEFKPDKAMGCKFQEYTRRQVRQVLNPSHSCIGRHRILSVDGSTQRELSALSRDTTCVGAQQRVHEYHALTSQVLGCLTNTTVVLWGDSMMRQVFSRVPSLFRGEIRSYDPQRWRAERYDACECVSGKLQTAHPLSSGCQAYDEQSAICSCALQHCVACSCAVYLSETACCHFEAVPALLHQLLFSCLAYFSYRAADVRTQAPPFDGLSPKDPHYQLWGLAELTDTDHPFFSFDKASVLASPHTIWNPPEGKVRAGCSEQHGRPDFASNETVGGHRMKFHASFMKTASLHMSGSCLCQKLPKADCATRKRMLAAMPLNCRFSMYMLSKQVPQTELVDIVDPNAQPKDFPAQTCGETRPASFQYLPATGFQPQYRFMGFYTKYVNTDLSQVSGCIADAT